VEKKEKDSIELSEGTLDNLLENILAQTDYNQELTATYQQLFEEQNNFKEEQRNYFEEKESLEYLSKEDQDKKSESYILEHQEARELIEQFQVKSMSNQKSEMSLEEKRKMALYWLFDRVLALFYHETSIMRTGDVDYSFPIG
jgi:hypothetical protein